MSYYTLSFCLSLQNISWSHHFISAILGAFEKLRNTITSLVMSVYPSIPLSICRMEKVAPTALIF
jgi:hypothetical protein